jgi:hypothetical protein
MGFVLRVLEATDGVDELVGQPRNLFAHGVDAA